MEHLINECRHHFAAAHGLQGLWDSITYRTVKKPEWLENAPDDSLHSLIDHMPYHWQDGHVVWSCIVDASSDLRDDLTEDRPGNILFAAQDRRPISFDTLRAIAGCVRNLPYLPIDDPEMRFFATYLADPNRRACGLQVPDCISPRFLCRVTTTLFVRKFLPRGRICRDIIPVIVNPKHCFTAFPLPSKYWPPALVDWWAN